MAAEQQHNGLGASRFRVERLQPNDYASRLDARTEQMGRLTERFAAIAQEFDIATINANIHGKGEALDGSLSLHRDAGTGTIDIDLFEEGLVEKLVIPEGAVIYKVEDELKAGEEATVWYQIKTGADPLVKDRKDVKAGQQVVWFYKNKNNQWGQKSYDSGALTYLVEDGEAVEKGKEIFYVVPHQTSNE